MDGANLAAVRLPLQFYVLCFLFSNSKLTSQMHRLSYIGNHQREQRAGIAICMCVRCVPVFGNDSDRYRRSLFQLHMLRLHSEFRAACHNGV